MRAGYLSQSVADQNNPSYRAEIVDSFIKMPSLRCLLQSLLLLTFRTLRPIFLSRRSCPGDSSGDHRQPAPGAVADWVFLYCWKGFTTSPFNLSGFAI